MERLSAAELRAVIEFAELVGEAPDLPSFAERCVAGIRSLVRCDMASYNEMNHGRGRAVALADPPEALFPAAEAVLARYLDVHPLVQHFARTHDTRARRLSDFVSRRRLRHTGLYQELFRPLGGEYLIALNVAAPPSVLVGLGLFRTSRDFSDRECALLDTVRPLVATAYRSAAARMALGTLEQALVEEDKAVVLVGRTGGVLYESGGVRERLRQFFPDGAPGLAADVEGWLERPGEPLVRERDGRRLVLRPIAGGDCRAFLVEEGPAGLTAASLAALPLSRREREVLALAASGATNAQIAAELLVSPRTVKKHLEQVYEKLGVHTRTAAAAIAHAQAR